MSNKNIRWLNGQLTELVDKGVIDNATRQQLSEHYDMDSVIADKSISIMTVILSAIGGLLVGGGVILIFAHNWENIGRPMRAVLAFLPLIVSQILCAMALFPKPRSQAWKETAAALMFCTVPACIALIGQTYHISDDTEAFLMWWFILLLPIVYLLRPHLTALLMVILATVLASFYQSPYWLCLVALIPYYLWDRSQQNQSMRHCQFSWALCLSMAIVLPVSLLFEEPESPVAIMLLAGALAMYFYGGNFEPQYGFGKRPFTNIGAIAVSICGLILSFSDFWRELLQSQYSDFPYFDMSWHAALLAWALLISFVILMIITIKRSNYRLLPLSALMVFVVAGFVLPYRSELALVFAIAVNLLMVALGIWYAMLGLKKHSTSTLNFGLVLVMAILLMRFFDQNLSFIGRGIAFIVMGSIFISVNVWHGRRRKI